MPQYAVPDNGQGRQSTAPHNAQSNKMVETFEEQQAQQNTTFAQSMDAIERDAKSAHAAREVDVEEFLSQITIKYDAADQQRHAQWVHAEQEMRGTSSARENWRLEVVQHQESTRYTIAEAALEKYAAIAGRRVAQLDALKLEDGVGATLWDLSGGVDCVISERDYYNKREPRPTRTLPSGTLSSVWDDRGSWLRITDRDLDLPTFPEENDIRARVLIETNSTADDGTAAPEAEELASPTVAGNFTPPTATNIGQILHYMQEVFEQAESVRAQQYVAVQRDIDEYDDGFDRFFAALQAQLDRKVVEFVDGFMRLEAEEAAILAAGSAISAFKAAEADRNAWYANWMRFNTAEVKVISQTKQALKSLEQRLAAAGLIQSRSSKVLIGYTPPVSGGSILDLLRGLFSRRSRPVASTSADNVTSARERAVVEASHGARAATYEQNQTGRLHDAEDKKRKRQVQFAQTKRRITLEAIDREKKRSIAFQNALDDVRNDWRARELARATTFESTIAQLGTIFLEAQAAREKAIERALEDMEENVTSAIEKATCEFRSMLELVVTGGYIDYIDIEFE